MNRYLRGVYYFAATVAIYLGLPLLGWGIGAMPAFLADGPRLGYAVAVILFGLAIGWQGIAHPEAVDGGHGQESKRVWRQTILGFGLTLLLFAALCFLPFAERRGIGVLGVSAGLRWVGVVLCATGYGLVFGSGLALGRQYSAEVTIQKDHHLITTGLYRYIRHPRYLGILCLCLGASLVYRSWIGLLLGVLVLAMLLMRVRDEEALMQREFGAEWEEYCKRSWRMIPGVY